ncbi:MAG: hypothetical protein JW726_05810 [Anaerolineales bacterium]|nr:hypothetical protein [Anaerolineales bacterium]
MPRIAYHLLLPFALLGLLLTACTSAEDSAALAVEGYIQSLIQQDANQLAGFSCSDWEAQAQIELDSLTGVTATTQDLQCQATSQEGDDILVECSGKIIFDYNGEEQELSLEGRTYIAREEAGEWRMCGYK